MKIHYLEIVASYGGAVCAAYETTHVVEFGSADPRLGGVRTARLPDGGSIGVRGPLRDTEMPTVRPYWLIADSKVALDAVSQQGALVAHAPLESPGKGTYSIYIQGDVDDGLWQR
jgi:uncharacterized protein